MISVACGAMLTPSTGVFKADWERDMRKHIPALALIFAAPLAIPATTGASEAAVVQQIGGTWDLTWQTRKGPTRKGYMVIEQRGVQLTARIHGQGSVKAKGSIANSGFTLRGSRMAVPYVISGWIEGGRMTGSLKVLTVERHFTGARREAR